jgi:hypothetical protein
VKEILRQSAVAENIFIKNYFRFAMDGSLQTISNIGGFSGVMFTTRRQPRSVRWAGITIDQNDDLDGMPDISKIDLILEVGGLNDSSSGTVTGAARIN